MEENSRPRKCEALVTATDDAFFPGAAVMIHSFLRTNRWFDGDVIVICDERLGQKSRDALSRIYDQVQFQPVRKQLLDRVDELARNKPEYARDKARFHYLETFALREYDRVLVCDSDILHCRSVHELFEIDHSFIATRDGAAYAGEGRDRETFERIPVHAGCLIDTFNCGFLLLSGELLNDENDRLLQESVCPEKWTATSGSTDQFLYNRRFEGSQMLVSAKYNFVLQHHSLIREFEGIDISDASILHFNMKVRPWETGRVLTTKFEHSEVARAFELWAKEYGDCVRSLHAPPPVTYLSANYDLEALVRTHLFILSPNNSGSTFLKNVLATHPETWNLRREGQHTFGFGGPNPDSLNIPYLWASEQRWMDLLADSGKFDWEKSRRAWYFQAFSRGECGSVFVEKSPPFLLHAETLAEEFRNAKFVFLIRDPYAVAESILRRVLALFSSREQALKAASSQIVNCFRLQAENTEQFAAQGIVLRYEDMCDDPIESARRLVDLVPELEGLNLNQRIGVKGTYDEPLRNMNSDQIGRLTPEDFDLLNQHFKDAAKDFEKFGYQLRES